MTLITRHDIVDDVVEENKNIWKPKKYLSHDCCGGGRQSRRDEEWRWWKTIRLENFNVSSIGDITRKHRFALGEEEGGFAGSWKWRERIKMDIECIIAAAFLLMQHFSNVSIKYFHLTHKGRPNFKRFLQSFKSSSKAKFQKVFASFKSSPKPGLGTPLLPHLGGLSAPPPPTQGPSWTSASATCRAASRNRRTF